MTHLETLVRTLPRQRRAFAAQVSRGFGMVCFGFVLASLAALRLLSEPHIASWSLFFAITWAIVGAYLMLFGGYRATKADILLHENAALIAAVHEELAKRRRNAQGDVVLTMHADLKSFEAEIERALEMAARDHRRGVR